MFVLRLTSDPSLHGAETDDGFIIGSFTGATVFLVGATALLGVLGGVFYLAVRSRFPLRIRPAVMGVFGGAVGGALVIRPGGVDFTEVRPQVLSILMFVALPAAYGVVMSILVERMLRPESFLQTSRLWPVGLIPMVPLLPTLPGLVILVLAPGLWLVRLKVPAVLRMWDSAPAVWAGRAVVAAVVLIALFYLVRDIAAVL